MEIETKKILVPVDSDPTTLKAVRYATHKALEMQNSGTPYSLVLVNLYSSFDLTGSSERDGKLALEQAESFAEASGVHHIVSVSDSSTSMKSDFLEWIDEEHIDEVIVGSNAYQSASDPNSWISNAWASILNRITTPLPQYLYGNAPCEVSLVAADSSTIHRAALRLNR